MPESASPAPSRRRIPLSVRVVLGVVLGATLGWLFGSDPWLLGLGNDDLGPVGMLVIRLLKALATPLILFAVLDSFLKTRISARSAWRLLGTCAVNITVAMLIGLTILNLARPGERWRGQIEALSADLAVQGQGAAAPKAPEGVKPSLSPLKNLAGFVPESVVEPLYKNSVIPLILLAVLSGAALRRLKDHPPEGSERAMEAVEGIVDVSYRMFSMMLLWVAETVPLAACFIIAQVVGKSGLGIFAMLWPFLAAILAGLLLHSLVYYPAVAWLVGGKSPRVYLGGGADAVLTGIGINSSLATMPVTLRCLKSMGVSEKAARLSACVGTNFNNDGIMLYEAMAALFLCQAYGYELSLGSQMLIVLSSVMVGVGIAGIPEAGLIILPLVLATAGLPEVAVASAIPLVVPVDWIIARVRTAVNVLADMLVAIVIDRLGEKDA